MGAPKGRERLMAIKRRPMPACRVSSWCLRNIILVLLLLTPLVTLVLFQPPMTTIQQQQQKHHQIQPQISLGRSVNNNNNNNNNSSTSSSASSLIKSRSSSFGQSSSSSPKPPPQLFNTTENSALLPPDHQHLIPRSPLMYTTPDAAFQDTTPTLFSVVFTWTQIPQIMEVEEKEEENDLKNDVMASHNGKNSTRSSISPAIVQFPTLIRKIRGRRGRNYGSLKYHSIRPTKDDYSDNDDSEDSIEDNFIAFPVMGTTTSSNTTSWWGRQIPYRHNRKDGKGIDDGHGYDIEDDSSWYEKYSETLLEAMDQASSSKYNQPKFQSDEDLHDQPAKCQRPNWRSKPFPICNNFHEFDILDRPLVTEDGVSLLGNLLLRPPHPGTSSSFSFLRRNNNNHSITSRFHKQQQYQQQQDYEIKYLGRGTYRHAWSFRRILLADWNTRGRSSRFQHSDDEARDSAEPSQQQQQQRRQQQVEEVVVENFVLKRMMRTYDIAVKDLYKVHRESVIMEQLTASPHVLDVWGYCATSIMMEKAWDVWQEIVPPPVSSPPPPSSDEDDADGLEGGDTEYTIQGNSTATTTTLTNSTKNTITSSIGMAGEIQKVSLSTSATYPPRNNLSGKEKLQWALQMAQGVAGLHGNLGGIIVHCDVDPLQWLTTTPPPLVGDIPTSMADDDPQNKSIRVLKLNDFNNGEIPNWRMSKQEYCPIFGTNFGYHRSPEEYANKPTSEAMDVFSLGNTYYALVTGQWPFQKTRDDSDTHHLDSGRIQQYVLNGTRATLDPRYYHSPRAKTSSSSEYFAESQLVPIIDLMWEHNPSQRISIFEVVRRVETAIQKYERWIKSNGDST